MKAISKIFVTAILATGYNNVGYSQLTSLPESASPKKIGEQLAYRFITSPHGVYTAPNTKPHIPYFEVCAWYGALRYARLSGNVDLKNKLIGRLDQVLTVDTALLPVPDHVDYNVFGAIPLEVYLQTNEGRYLQIGKYYADKQWGKPEGPRVNKDSYIYFDKGYSWQTRLWIDDMYMITLLQSQAYRATRDESYINRTAREMVLYLDSLQKPNGLFYHAPDAPFYWGRGNGWMAAGMTELLRALPNHNPDRTRIMKGYQLMMQALKSFQTNSGKWCQLVNDTSSWNESSSSAMFTYALITGVKMGWLDKPTYMPVARNGWIGLVSFINENGDVTDVCEGTGKKDDREYYLNRKRIVGDFHGQAPVLWCASALLEQ